MLDAKIAPAPGGAADSLYTVVAKVADANSCPSDIDQTYCEELNGSTTGVLCVDTDWVVDSCFEMGVDSDSTVQVPCTGPTGERILAVLPNTVDETDCPQRHRPTTPTTNAKDGPQRRTVLTWARADAVGAAAPSPADPTA